MAPATQRPPQDAANLLLNGRLDEGIRVELMTITPALAARWLRRNHANRTLKVQSVGRLVRALKSEQWTLNGATIVFSDRQELMDGQHRLQAVMDSGCSLQSLVVFGIPDTARATIDTGQSRTLRDFFSLRGHPNATRLASALTFLKAWERGNTGEVARTSLLFVTYDEAYDYFQRHLALADSVTRINRLPHLMRPAHLAALDYRFRASHPEVAEAWYATMQSGRVDPHYAVFLTLRERLIRDRTDGKRLHTLEPFVYNLKAWNAAVTRDTIKVFKWHETEGIPSLR